MSVSHSAGGCLLTLSLKRCTCFFSCKSKLLIITLVDRLFPSFLLSPRSTWPIYLCSLFFIVFEIVHLFQYLQFRWIRWRTWTACSLSFPFAPAHKSRHTCTQTNSFPWCNLSFILLTFWSFCWRSLCYSSSTSFLLLSCFSMYVTNHFCSSVGQFIITRWLHIASTLHNKQRQP